MAGRRSPPGIGQIVQRPYRCWCSPSPGSSGSKHRRFPLAGRPCGRGREQSRCDPAWHWSCARNAELAGLSHGPVLRHGPVHHLRRCDRGACPARGAEGLWKTPIMNFGRRLATRPQLLAWPPLQPAKPRRVSPEHSLRRLPGADQNASRQHREQRRRRRKSRINLCRRTVF